MEKRTSKNALSRPAKLLGATCFAVTSLLWAAPIGDSKACLGQGGRRWFDRVAHWVSAVAWVSVIPVAVYMAGLRFNHHLLWALALVLPAGIYFFGRRFAAAKGRHARVHDLLSAMQQIATDPASQFVDDVNTKTPFNPWWLTLRSGVGAMLVGLVLALAPVAAPLLDDALPGVVAWAVAWYPAIVLGGVIGLAIVAGRAGLVFGRDDENLQAQKARGAVIYSKALGISVSDFQAGGAEFRYSADGSTITIEPLPIAVRGRFGPALDTSVETYMPGWAVGEANVDRVVLVKAETVPEVLASRQARAASGGMITRFVDEPDTARRPAHVRWEISPEFFGRLDEVDAFARSRDETMRLVEWDPVAGVASLARVPSAVQQVRDRVAAILGCAAWDVELTLNTSEGRSQHGYAERVHVIRTPFASRQKDKRKAFWLEHVPAIVGTPVDHIWRFEEDWQTGDIMLTCVVDPLREVIPFSADPSTPILPRDLWAVGRDEGGADVTIDLANSAHLLIAGATRSGKSIATYSLIIHVLRMGSAARLLVADPNDTTIAPFEPLVSWSTSETTPEPVTRMLQWVRAEMDRRKPLLRTMRRDKVSVFTPDMPLLVVVIDEAANYMRHANKVAAAAMTNELLAVASQGAKYGVRLVLITQRPDSTILPTAVRSQLSARISFRVESLEDARMMFPDLENPAEMLGFAPGVGLYKDVAGQPRRFRSEFLEDHWAAADSVAQALPLVDIADLGMCRTNGSSPR